MASLLDPYTPQETANLTQGRPIAAQSDPGTIPPIPGMDAPYSANPAAAAYQHGAQAYAQGAQQLQQERLKTQHVQDATTAATRIQAFANDPANADRAWWQLTPEERQARTAEIQKLAPTAVPDIPGYWNAAQTAVSGRPIGAKINPDDIASGKANGVEFSQLPPNTTDENGQASVAPQETMAQMIAKGDLSANLGRFTPQQKERIYARAAQINPDFKGQDFETRQGVLKSFASGPDAANVTSANTIVGHLGEWLKAAEDLHNQTFTPWNYVANAEQAATGKPAQVTFQTKADALASEMAKLFKGTGAANESEVKEWRNNLSPNMSPEQFKAAAQSAMQLMGSRLDALKEKYTSGLGQPPAKPFLGEKSRAILESHGLISPEGQSVTRQPQGAQGPTGAPQVQQVDSQQQYDALPKGAQYRDSHGRIGTKR